MDEASQHSPATSYESSPDRENIFHGQEGTWSGYTKQERELANSLAREQANDLSVHLYNAHAIKALQYDRQKPHSSWQSKSLWIRTNEDGARLWTPSQAWTAWPMSAEDVPRLEERHGNLEAMRVVDDQTLKRAEPWYPGTDLEDEVFALLLRQAKNQFQARSHESGRLHRSENSSGKSQSLKHVSSQESAREQLTAQDESEAQPHGNSSPSLQLVDDDDHGRALLLPSTRHILSSLDNLLLALHKSRAGRNAAATAAFTSGDLAISPRKRKRTSTIAIDPHQSEELEDDNDEDHTVELEHKPRKPHARQSHTRDWSEVLGIATMAGLDQDIIAKTAQRCSAVFGEAISGVGSNLATDLSKEPKERSITKKQRKGLTQRRCHTPGDNYLVSVLEELSHFGRHR